MKITIVSLDNWGFNSYIEKALIGKEVETSSINFNDFRYKYPSIFHRIFNFFLKNLFGYNLKQIHLKKQISSRIISLEKQDVILVIKPDFLNRETLIQLKEKSHKLITFLNDSISRCPKMKNNLDLFHSVFSFEDDDCEKYGFLKINNFIYTSLDAKLDTQIEYDVFNISSVDKRKKTTPLLVKYFNSKKISYKIIILSKNKRDDINGEGISIIRNPYTIPEMLHYLKKCKIVLDLQRPKQKGLSFRVFESLAFEKKLITLNKDIIKYDFYDPKNILVIDDLSNINITEDFLKSKYNSIDCNILKKYHISNWINDVFNL